MSIQIHETAIVDSKAELGENIQIGPYSIIDGSVQIGDGSQISSHVRITGHTTIGKNNRFFHGCTIGEEAQDINWYDKDSCVIIGDGNIFRESFTIHRPNKNDGLTQVGNHCYFMAYSHVAHDCSIADSVIIANHTSLSGFVTIERNAFVSGYVGIHQYCRIGMYSMLGAQTGVSHDVPPFVIAVGNRAKAVSLNVRGMKRMGFTSDSLSSLRKAFQVVYQQDKKIKDAIREIHQILLPEIKDKKTSYELVSKFVHFIENSQRGIILYDHES